MMHIAQLEVRQSKKIERAAISMATGIPMKYPKVTVRPYLWFSSALMWLRVSMSTDPKTTKRVKRKRFNGILAQMLSFLNTSNGLLPLMLIVSISAKITPQANVGRCYLTALS